MSFEVSALSRFARWDVESSHKALSLIKEQSLSEIKKLEEALKRRKEPEASENSVVSVTLQLFCKVSVSLVFGLVRFGVE